MTRRYVAFDIETAKVLPESVSDLMDHRPLGIACVAAAVSGCEEPFVWYGANGGKPAAQMAQDEVCSMIEQFGVWADEGYTLLSWNGLGFDFNVLAEESGLAEDCARIALDHVDMMFHVVCELGYPVGLGKAAEGFGLPGKREGMTGYDAPVMWAQGRYDDVLEYNLQDARLALTIALEAERRGELLWITRRGTTGHMPLRQGWRSVRQALQTPRPDTSWMSDPPAREDFIAWLPSDSLMP
ncbi:MAG TPA: ribonuclease H-like domain-containing protein [Gaiellaceae bacterium]